MRFHGLAILGLVLLMTACATPSASTTTSSGQTAPPQPSKTLTAAVRVEPSTAAVKNIRGGGVALYLSGRMFNADLAMLDDQANPRMYVADALPQLNSDSWQIFPDGRMQTTYHLKPNVVWHDGVPLTAEDYVFSWQVYTWTDLQPTDTPFNIVQEASALDPQTLVLKWKQPYADAGSLTDRGREFPPLPKHILDSSFTAGNPDNFAANPYWTTQYVGLGPYKLDHWEPGAYLEASAFDKHVLGKAKIDRIRVQFMPDSDTVLASLLSGDVQLSGDTSLRVGQVPIVLRQWNNQGTAVLHPNQWRSVLVQVRPEYAKPAGLLDPRVRKALAFSIDKDPINQAVYDGQSTIAETMIVPTSATGKVVDAAITKYPYDPKRGEQMMTDAGYKKGSDGTYVAPDGTRFTTEIRTNAATDNETEMSALADGWRKLGFDVRDSVLPAALAQDNEARATFGGLFSFNTNVGEAAAITFTSSKIAKPENRWQGANRSGWSNADYDRLTDTFNTTIDRSERAKILAQMAKIFNDELPSISLFFRTQPWVFPSALTGPKLVPPESNVAWNMYEWELK